MDHLRKPSIMLQSMQSPISVRKPHNRYHLNLKTSLLNHDDHAIWRRKLLAHEMDAQPPSESKVSGTSPPSTHEAKLESLYEGFKAKFADVPEITAMELHGWLQTASTEPSDISAAPVVVDVRTRTEQQVSQLPSPWTLTQQDFEKRGAEAFRGRRIVCYCTAGYRSGLFAAKLRREHGLDAYNLRGSILAWTQAGLPLTDPRDGSSTTRVHTFNKDWALQGEGYTPVMFQWPLLQPEVVASLWRLAVGTFRRGRGGAPNESRNGD